MRNGIITLTDKILLEFVEGLCYLNRTRTVSNLFAMSK